MDTCATTPRQKGYNQGEGMAFFRKLSRKPVYLRLKRENQGMASVIIRFGLWAFLLVGSVASAWGVGSSLGGEWATVESRLQQALDRDDFAGAGQAWEALRKLSDGSLHAALRLDYWAGCIDHEKGDAERAIHALHAAARRADQLGEPSIQGNSLWRLVSLQKADMDSSEVVGQFEQAIRLLEGAKDTVGLCAAWYELGAYWMESSKDAQGKMALETAGELAKAAHLLRAQATIQNYWGVYHISRGEFAEATQPSLQSLQVYEQLGLMSDVARTQNMVGTCLNRMGEVARSKQYLEAALKTAQKHGPKYVEASALTNLGVISQEGGAFDAALDYLLDAYELYRVLNHTAGQAACLNNIAFNYEQKGDFSQAIIYQKKALDMDRRNQDPYGEAISLCNLGEYHRQMGKFAQALDYYQQCEGKVLALGTTGIESYLYQGISDTYKATGDFEQALGYKEKVDSIQRLTENKGQDSAVGMVMEYEGMQQAQQLAHLEGKYQWMTWLAIIATILVLAAGTGWLIMILWKRRLNRELQQLDREMAAKDKELGNLQEKVAHLGEELERQKELLDVVKRENGEDAELSQDAFIAKLRARRHWPTFLAEFEMHHPAWLQELRSRYPELNSTDIRLLALAKLGLSTSEAADFLNITVAGIKKARQRIRKKLELENEDSLDRFLNSI